MNNKDIIALMGDKRKSTTRTPVFVAELVTADIPNAKVEDGLTIVSVDGKLHRMFGWSPYFSPVTNNRHYTYDNVSGWVKVSDCDAPRRHSNGYGTRIVGGVTEVLIWGGDQFGGNNGKDIWKYRQGVWTQLTNDWGLVASGGVSGKNRYIFSWCMHKGYMYMMGGQSDYNGDGATIFYNDCVRSIDGITWVKMGNVPITYCTGGTLFSDGSNLFFMSGAAYRNGGVHSDYNNRVFKSINDGGTWTQIATIPEAAEAIYSNGVYYGGQFYYLNGYKSPAGNRKGLWTTSDWQTLTPVVGWDSIGPRHATGICSHNSEVYICCGNMWNDLWRVIKI